MVNNDKDAHFNTPANFSFNCYTEQGIELHEMNTTKSQETISSVTLSMWSTQIQAFELPADGEFKEGKSKGSLYNAH